MFGYNRQHIKGNWKLMQENIKDPYHAWLLHVFFVTFGLFRADQKSATEVETGRHGILISRRGQQEVNDVTSTMRTFRGDIQLADARILEAVKEYPDEDAIQIMTLFPSVVLQSNLNSLSTRHIVPTGPDGFDFHWTHWGYADDTPEMRQRRMRQSNLFGPAGLVSADDGETIDYGPCAFLDQYNPATVFSSIDHFGRYAYGNQPNIGLWNLARFAETLLPLLAEDKDQAVAVAKSISPAVRPAFPAGLFRGPATQDRSRHRPRRGCRNCRGSAGAHGKERRRLHLDIPPLCAAAASPEGDAAVRALFADPNLL